VALGVAVGAEGQQPVARILEQDSTLNNLADPTGYETGVLGELGALEVTGTGERPMILVAGLGFGGEIFRTLTEEWRDDYTMYAVTLPGFGGTAAPPSPPAATSFGEQTWTNAAVDAVERLILDEDLDGAIVVGHWIGGTQVAVRVAQRQADRIEAVVLLAGSARAVPAQENPPTPPPASLEERIAGVDDSLAPNWFKTVTRETWDDNNFFPHDYAVNPVLGLRLWRQAARPRLHVWVRYLCEFLAQDVTLDLADLETPLLLVRPGLEDVPHDPGLNYMEAYLHRSWEGAPLDAAGVVVTTIPNTRAVPWADRPEAVRNAVEVFLADHVSGPPPG
jgi:pimeloyl-ACP methyl ester carboxylesterase